MYNFFIGEEIRIQIPMLMCLLTWQFLNFVLSINHTNRDNPKIKVLFAIRDPVSRLQSHHRFIYNSLNSKGFGSLNDIVSFCLNESGKCYSFTLLQHLFRFSYYCFYYFWCYYCFLEGSLPMLRKLAKQAVILVIENRRNDNSARHIIANKRLFTIFEEIKKL
jgi:hypothetical protein